MRTKKLLYRIVILLYKKNDHALLMTRKIQRLYDYKKIPTQSSNYSKCKNSL